MKIGCFSVLFSDKKLEEVAKILQGLGVEAIELGTGNYPGDAHCKPDELLDDESKQKALKELLDEHGLEISALSCHGNSLHPDKNVAAEHEAVRHKTTLLAEQLGVPVVVTFSGCPGADEGSKSPNWVTCPWPDDYSRILKWQWEEKVIPYWKKEADFADEHGVKYAFEMHPGFVVYNTETLLRVRSECGKTIGANFDPSHLFWQGMDPVQCVRALGGDAIFHVHAKDCKIYQPSRVNGVLDTKPYGDEVNRSWIFRTVGYGHGVEWWKDFASTLRMVGYDHVLSIEHEDSLMAMEEGLSKAVEALKQATILKKPGEMFWA
ncbi:MAG: sugar phosphate isomerase/epimerase family protein [Promethearchaeota archaeon]